MVDLFGPRDVTEVFALGEIFVHPGVGSHGVWWQGLVSWSTSLGGIKAQAERHWHHRFSTAEAFGLSPEQMREELNLVIYRLHLPEDQVDIDGPANDSFTWQPRSSYRQLRHVQGWIARTLHVAGEQQARKEYASAVEGTWEYEQLEAIDAAISHVTSPVGELMMMDRFDPKSDVPPEEDEREVTCIACSL